MFARSTIVAIASVGFLGLAGCGPAKLDMSQTYEMTSDDARILRLDPQPKPQTIHIQFESTQALVTVLLAKAADATGSNEDAAMTPIDKAIAFKKGEKSGDFTGEVPPNTATVVIIRDVQGKTSVKVHVTN
ncbi:MAG TPA: hypothetical protein VGI99_05745 [Gemmataceae bacterium]